MPKPTARQRLADFILGRPVAEFISDRRADGASFHDIAASLRDATAGEVDVTVETIRQWHAATHTPQESA